MSALFDVDKSLRPYIARQAFLSTGYDWGRAPFKSYCIGLLGREKALQLHQEGVLRKIYDELTG